MSFNTDHLILTLWFGVFNHSHDRLIMFQVLNIPRPKFHGITQHTIPSLEDCCRSDWTLGLTYGLEYNRKPERCQAGQRLRRSAADTPLAVSQRQRPLALDGVQGLTAIKAVRCGQRPVDYILAVGKLEL